MRAWSSASNQFWFRFTAETRRGCQNTGRDLNPRPESRVMNPDRLRQPAVGADIHLLCHLRSDKRGAGTEPAMDRPVWESNPRQGATPALPLCVTSLRLVYVLLRVAVSTVTRHSAIRF